MASDTLGSRLRAERESRGLTLDQLSASTKIPASLLEALERDDLSRWPKGLYRRAFFRSYVTALGLRPEPLVIEFARLFPDESSPHPFARESALSATAAVTRERTRAAAAEGDPLGRAVVRSGVEVAGILAAGTLFAWTASMDLLAATGAVALMYYPVARAAAGRGRPAGVLRRRAAVGQACTQTVATREAGAVEMAPPVTRDGAAQPAHSWLAIAGAGIRHVYAYGTGHCVPFAAGVARRTGHGARRTARWTAHTSRRCAQATRRLSTPVVSWTGAVVSRGTVASIRVLGNVASQAHRLSSRAAETASQAFWTGVRAAAEQAELLATRQLNRTRD
jgi:transcriptional regulator with XRE-family HTH domain